MPSNTTGEKFLIRGGRALEGEVLIRGSKNAAPKMMVASLLTDEPCFIENIPISAEIDITKELCEDIGSEVVFPEDHICRIETREVKTSLVPELSRKNRIPILALGPLLHRSGSAEVPVLGGCPIGHRPINLHIEALNKMGVRVERRERSYFAEAREIRGAQIEFPFPSVGATESVILTGVLAHGKTIIKNAAVEPEILNLIGMLKAMGARIEVRVESRVIQIEGVKKLHGARIRVMPDRTEAVSFAVAALATRGNVFLQSVEEEPLRAFLIKVREAGGKFEAKNKGIRFWGEGSYLASFIETSPHPGFMTDWASPFCVLLTQARGQSIIHETVYEDRFGYTKDLGRMGARVEVSDECPGEQRCRFFGKTFNHSARITGPTKLKGTEITMTDIRAGMAHIIAALIAEGESVITGVEHVDRGYERIDERLRALGADIKRV